jgi:hypothetical protein
MAGVDAPRVLKIRWVKPVGVRASLPALNFPGTSSESRLAGHRISVSNVRLLSVFARAAGSVRGLKHRPLRWLAARRVSGSAPSRRSVSWRPSSARNPFGSPRSSTTSTRAGSWRRRPRRVVRTSARRSSRRASPSDGMVAGRNRTGVDRLTIDRHAESRRHPRDREWRKRSKGRITLRPYRPSARRVYQPAALP